jgi:hypothetical protein
MGGTDRIGLAQDRDTWRAVENAAMNLQVPKNKENFLSSLGALSIWGMNLPRVVSKLKYES